MSIAEIVQRMTPEELTQHLNQRLETRMFLVGHSITVADILSLGYVIEYFVRASPMTNN